MSKGKRALIVDDEPDLREILSDEFRYNGYTVTTAADGVSALNIYKQEKPDVIVSDIRMPAGDGVILTKAVRQLDPNGVRIFLITGFADISPVDAYDCGVDGFFSKPFNLEVIGSAVEKSMKQGKDRWSDTSHPVSATITLNSLDWKTELTRGVGAMGRGGICLPEDAIHRLQTPLTTHEVIYVKCADQILFTGVVRWLKLDANSRLWYGIEFLNMTPQFLEFYQAQTDILAKSTFIPANGPSV